MLTEAELARRRSMALFTELLRDRPPAPSPPPPQKQQSSSPPAPAPAAGADKEEGASCSTATPLAAKPELGYEQQQEEGEQTGEGSAGTTSLMLEEVRRPARAREGGSHSLTHSSTHWAAGSIIGRGRNVGCLVVAAACVACGVVPSAGHRRAGRAGQDAAEAGTGLQAHGARAGQQAAGQARAGHPPAWPARHG